MKTKNKLISIIPFAMLAMFAFAITGCEQDWEKEFSTSTLKQPITATVEVNTIKDSSAVINYSLSDKGRIYIIVLAGDDNTAAPQASTMLNLSTSGAVFKKQYVLSEDPYSGSVKVTGLVQNTSYKVFALPVNTDGVLGTIATTDAFTTSDSYKPTLDLTSGVSPAISGTAKQALAFSVNLTFSEPVVLSETYDIQMGYRNAITTVISWVAVPKDSIKIEGKVVTIKQPLKASEQLNGMYVFLTIGADAFLDRAGNKYDGVNSGIVEGYLTGIYWRNIFENTVAQQILPKEAVTSDTGMKIVLDYPIKMRFPFSTEQPQYDQTKVIVRYKSAGTTIDMEVPKGNVQIVNDTLVQITLPRTPVYGETVTFSIAEGMFRNSYGNASAAIAFGAKSWFISYGYDVSLITASYSVDLVDNSGNPAGTYNASIDVAKGGTEVLIKDFVKNFYSLTEDAPISGTFDGDFGTISVPDWQPLFKTTVSGKEGWVYFANRYSTDDVVGHISSAGNFNLDGWGFYFLSDDETVFGWLNRFNTSAWTKGSKGTNNQPNELSIETFGKRF